MVSYIFFSVILGALAVASTAHPKPSKKSPKRLEPPTVSLLIPVRDEHDSITNVLHQALALDYPRLEIIVLDDNSSDKTPERVRAFAQDGVRFIAGTPPPPDWIGKNWAMHQLAQAASGSYLVFADANVILRSRGFNRIIHTLATQEVDTVSALPRLVLTSPISFTIFPLFYWLIRLTGKITTPHVSAFGGLMAFSRDKYLSHGGYERYRNEVLAEFKISRDFMRSNSYQLILGVSASTLFIKDASSLLHARIRYLQPLYARFSVLAAIHFLLAILPLALLAFAPWLLLAYLAVFFFSMRRFVERPLLATLLLPISASADLLFLGISAYKHAKGLVTWKDRPVP